MSEIAAMVTAMLEAGAPADAIGVAVEAYCNKPSNGAFRTRKWRHKTSRVTNGDALRRDVTDVTAAPRARAEPKITTSENPRNNTPPSPPMGALPPKQKNRGSRLPEHFVPDLNEALKEGFSREEGEREQRKFLNHYRSAPGQRGVRVDWPATWTNWCLKAIEYRAGMPNGPGRGPPKQPTISDIHRTAMESLNAENDTDTNTLSLSQPKQH